ncbi:Hsp20/alpha crystallin family protein [Variovorax brevis]|uniref:Hsp20/alpha crystallin family protein n=1 Tax=Variovorax brevis TaxID=3053503 RepID=UPI003365A210
MYRSLFARDLFAGMDRLQRDMQQALDPSPSIRGLGRGFPRPERRGNAPDFGDPGFRSRPGAGCAGVTLDRGILPIAGNREPLRPNDGNNEGSAAVHISERFDGPFRRAIAHSDDADPDALSATYRDGVLRITIQCRASSQPRRIDIQ